MLCPPAIGIVLPTLFLLHAGAQFTLLSSWLHIMVGELVLCLLPSEVQINKDHICRLTDWHICSDIFLVLVVFLTKI